MKNIGKCGEENADSDGSCSLSRLPDEIILLILNKVMDMKSLCCCCLVSRRFSSLVFKVDAITFIAPPIGPIDYVKGDIIRNVFCSLINTPALLDLLSSDRDDALFPLLSAIRVLIKFRGVKSVSIELPSSPHVGIDNGGCLFKWKAKFGKGIKCLYFLLPNSEADVNGNGDVQEEEEEDIDTGFHNNFYQQNFRTSIKCLVDADGWHKILLYLLRNLPMLEKVSITDSGRSGRLSISGEKLRELKEWVHSAFRTLLTHSKPPKIMSNCYIPSLKLPVSGYLMKGVYLLVVEMKGHEGEYDNSDHGFEGKQEARFTEALMEILKKHKSRMERTLISGWVDVVHGSGSECDTNPDLIVPNDKRPRVVNVYTRKRRGANVKSD